MKKLILTFCYLYFWCGYIYAADTDSMSTTAKERVLLILDYSWRDSPFNTYAGQTVNCTIANPYAKESELKCKSELQKVI